MKKFIIENDFWQLFPEAKIGIVVCKNINNTISDTNKFQKIINDAQIEAKKYLIADIFSENEIIKNWRTAYQKFKTKKGARSSIEALLKRVNNDNQLNSINPLVDIYNSISLKYGLPCGGEDIAKISGNMKLTKANGTEEFITLGTDEIAFPFLGEIVYKDEIGTICRSLNWRESTRTMLTENTKKALLCIELINDEKQEDLNKALNELSKMIQKHLAGTCQIAILDKNNNEFFIDK